MSEPDPNTDRLKALEDRINAAKGPLHQIVDGFPDDGARFAFSELPSDILTLAKAL